MIVKFAKPGASFKGLAQYLTHDAGHAQTTERVAWTHTLNCAHDHVPSAVHEMFTTAADADLLKEAAGVHKGGRKVEKPVKHVSLNWHPDEKPTRPEMIYAAQEFLRQMNWSEHQVVLVAHDDQKHKHVHLVINAIHPETGRKLYEGLERRRAQVWALGYEQSRGQVWCPERLNPVGARAKSPPRPVHEILRGISAPPMEGIAIDPAPDADEKRPWTATHGWRAQEWSRLKELQKEERIAFFAGGKTVYRQKRQEAYQRVRQQYRAEWRDFYKSKKMGMPRAALAERKADILSRQKETLSQEADVSAFELRHQRDREYRLLLDHQKKERARLINAQEKGQPSPHLFAGRPALQPTLPLQGQDVPRESGQGVSWRRSQWTNRGGMAAQQRSAARWHERAQERLATQKDRPEREQASWRMVRRERQVDPQPRAGPSRGKDKAMPPEMEPGLDT